jgi:NAD(P)-dependent dehydrogenase (short-subunit alcohol dehydrogenase family)
LTLDGFKDRWEEWKQFMGSKCPLGKIGTPEEVAGVCVFLAAVDADYVTGQIVYMGGPFMPC